MENLAKLSISELAPRATRTELLVLLKSYRSEKLAPRARGRSDFCGDFSTKKTCFPRTRTEHRIFNVFQIIFTRSTRMEWKTYENLRKPQNSLHAHADGKLD
jgi:hypothetical protein